MKNISKILELICTLPGIAYCYILQLEDGGFSVLAKSGKVNIKTALLEQLNEEIAKLKSADSKSVKKLSVWEELSAGAEIAEVNLSEVFSDNKESYVLVSLIDESGEAPQKSNQFKFSVEILAGELSDTQHISAENLEAGILENSASAVLYTDKNGKKVFSNDEFNEIFGLSGKEPPNFTLTGFKLYDSAGKLLSREDYPYIAAAQKNESVFIENLHFKMNDDDLKLSANSLLIRDSGGQPEYVLTSFWNADAGSAQSGAIDEAAENAAAVLYLIDAKTGEYLYVSKSIKDYTGIPAEEVNANRISALRRIHPRQFNRFKLFTEELRKGNAAKLDYVMLDDNGEEKLVRNSGYPVVENEKVVRIAGTVLDISDMREVQTELRKSEERFKLLVETADDLIFTLNSSGYFSTINESGSALLGYRPDEITGKHFLEFVGEKGKARVAIAFQKILNSDHVTSFEVEFIDKIEKSVMMEVQAQPLKSGGEITGMLGIGRNITDRIKSADKLKELNAKLIEANRIISIERDRAQQQITILEELGNLKNEFISNVSHELRTPLASIVGFAETIASDPDLPRDMITEFNEIMLTEGKRLAKLINDVLDFSRVEAGDEQMHLSDFDVVEVLNEIGAAYSVQAKEKGLTFNNQVPEAEMIITADKDRISRVFGNILSNAVKFTEKGGIISVIAQDFLKEVEIIFTDTGIGIPEKEIPKLFEKFQKVNHPGAQLPGAGFGLAVVKQIVDLHKGLIQIKSELKKGTTVIIRLPKK